MCQSTTVTVQFAHTCSVHVALSLQLERAVHVAVHKLKQLCVSRLVVKDLMTPQQGQIGHIGT